ncbi:MAG: rhodanese-like domain-containing protein [candidate division Zixibacteria bacterium]|nr:rhodanese-like domain-containing protein [candidate division Zixibacteria bacterium]MDH3937771.1 rhodanese-like domain-containing protein [candidate division Zixibacteria bacterium]MDH4033991.1 rhodanese-like domain-containing protein [candidate division Zixibacteria bacterium]
MALKQAVYILIISTVLGLGLNMVRADRIPYFGQWRSLHSGEGPITPPQPEAGDPPFVTIDGAQIDFNSGVAVFIDAREPEEFECGSISGAISIPFDYLPETDLGPYFDSVLAGVPKDRRMVVFCSGDECDLSIHLARNMQAEGYTDLAIFFGGSREWERFGLPMERRSQCDE